MDNAESLVSLVSSVNITGRKDECLLGSATLDAPLLSILPELIGKELIDGLVKIDSECRDIEEINENDIGKEVVIGIVKSSVHRYIEFYDSIDELISVPSNKLSRPDRFYLIDSSFFYPCSDIPDKIQHYFDLIKLLVMLKDVSDYQYGFSNVIEKLVFLHKSRFDLSLKYDSESLIDSIDGLSVILGFFEGEEHIEQKKSILKEILIGMLSDIPDEKKLKYLISNFGEFSKRFVENYQYFVSEFSFDEVRVEYEEKKREYLVKIDEVFSATQLRMLGVPVSLAVVAFKMSPVVSSIPTFLINFLLLFSVAAYSYMMRMLLVNQRHTLAAIKGEYSSHMRRLKYQFSDQYDNIYGIKKDLDERYKFQKKNLVKFNRISVLLVIVVLLIFFWYLPWMSVYQYVSSMLWLDSLKDAGLLFLGLVKALTSLFVF
ncbi:hypothetical protein [Microbulbifer spongiae]|uniref:Uncharacterized protein n=1 Tax=Microbulbifer spongiae TaxID=2944933 RepID=A0ABY9ECA2_9GAMM|nr:hypothetical protein [Microbulbifer sp. MI-G]WKD48980.1 hypothetical protein M8T91_13910 [Microbulbifer sp. MI-G]